MSAAPRRVVRRLTDAALWGAAALGLLSMVTAVGPRALPALAFWTDDGEVTTGAFEAHVVESPANIDCYNEGGILGLLGYVRMNWAHVDTRYVYDWRIIRDSTGQVAATGTMTPPEGMAEGAPLEREIRIGLLDIGLGGITYTFEVTARLRGTDWSAGTVVTEGLRTQQLLVGLSVRCTNSVNGADAPADPHEPSDASQEVPNSDPAVEGSHPEPEPDPEAEPAPDIEPGAEQ